jgi:predicted SprT family Zn-dependent metalloprotease
MSNRGDFKEPTKRALALRAGYICSFEDSGKSTAGPSGEFSPGAILANRSSRPIISIGRKADGFSTDLLSDAQKKRALEWIRLWRVPSLLRAMSFRRNSLLRATIARWSEKATCLELGPRFFEMAKRQDEILCHELAHAAAVQIHGRKISPHGPEWRALINAAGFAPSAIVKSSKSRSPALSRTKSSWYEHRCPVCQGVRFARKQMGQWRCAECSQQGLQGLLEISRLEERL